MAPCLCGHLMSWCSRMGLLNTGSTPTNSPSRIAQTPENRRLKRVWCLPSAPRHPRIPGATIFDSGGWLYRRCRAHEAFGTGGTLLGTPLAAWLMATKQTYFCNFEVPIADGTERWSCIAGGILACFVSVDQSMSILLRIPLKWILAS